MQVEIKIKGELGKNWQDWFDALEMVSDGNTTTLQGHLPDESSLHGVLNQIRDLNLKLISVNITGE